MQPLQVGIIGFGRIGAEHAGWLARAKGISAVAACDLTLARRMKAIAAGLNAFETPEAVFNDPGVAVVLIALPTSMHFGHALSALEAGKHVMIEKPMTLDAAEARKLIAMAQKKERVLSVFQNRRWDVDFLTVAEAVGSGVFGRVINVESRLGQWSSCVGPAAREWRPQWRNEAQFGGGGLYDWGSHFVDQLWRLMLPAKSVRVFAQLRSNVWSDDCDDFARVCVDFDNGSVGLVEINTTTTRPLPRWHIDGTLGSAESPFSAEFDTRRWAQLDFTPGQGGDGRRLPVAMGGMDEVAIWEQFGSAVRGEGEAAVTAESVLPTMELLDAARRSSREGTAIDVAFSGG